ncbi:hypothetical protein D3C78_1575140 [compost metagenome]
MCSMLASRTSKTFMISICEMPCRPSCSPAVTISPEGMRRRAEAGVLPSQVESQPAGMIRDMPAEITLSWVVPLRRWTSRPRPDGQ